MQKINQAADLTADKLAMQAQNPANLAEKSVAERKRVPMTAPMRRLEVAEMPGFHLQWLRGTPERLNQAMAAGFEFVTEDELGLNNHDLGGDAKTSGNTDMGTRVSTGEGSGELGADGQAVRLYLMKQRKEFYNEDRAITQARNDAVVDSLTARFREGTVGVGAEGAPVETSDDLKLRYVGKQSQIPEIFKRKPDRS